MKEVESKHPPGVIGIPMATHARYTGVFYDLDALHVPLGTKLIIASGVNVAYNCNNIVKAMTPEHEWLWILGDDHRFEPETLLALLARDAAVVVPVVCRRGAPFQTVLYRVASTEHGSFLTYSWGDLTRHFPNGGVGPVDAAGTAGMLIRSHVLAAVGDPWFDWGKTVSEDIGFCLKARAKGYEILVDTDQRLTHTTNCELLPYRDKSGAWNVAAQVGDYSVSLLNPSAEKGDPREFTIGRRSGESTWLREGRAPEIRDVSPGGENGTRDSVSSS